MITIYASPEKKISSPDSLKKLGEILREEVTKATPKHEIEVAILSFCIKYGEDIVGVGCNATELNNEANIKNHAPQISKGLRLYDSFKNGSYGIWLAPAEKENISDAPREKNLTSHSFSELGSILRNMVNKAAPNREIEVAILSFCIKYGDIITQDNHNALELNEEAELKDHRSDLSTGINLYKSFITGAYGISFIPT